MKFKPCVAVVGSLLVPVFVALPASASPPEPVSNPPVASTGYEYRGEGRVLPVRRTSDLHEEQGARSDNDTV